VAWRPRQPQTNCRAPVIKREIFLCITKRRSFAKFILSMLEGLEIADRSERPFNSEGNLPDVYLRRSQWSAVFIACRLKSIQFGQQIGCSVRV
jgi:hypothetical protein